MKDCLKLWTFFVLGFFCFWGFAYCVRALLDLAFGF